MCLIASEWLRKHLNFKKIILNAQQKYKTTKDKSKIICLIRELLSFSSTKKVLFKFKTCAQRSELKMKTRLPCKNASRGEASHFLRDLKYHQIQNHI